MDYIPLWDIYFRVRLSNPWEFPSNQNTLWQVRIIYIYKISDKIPSNTWQYFLYFVIRSAYHNHSWTTENHVWDGLWGACLEAQKKEGKIWCKTWRGKQRAESLTFTFLPPPPSSAVGHPEASWSRCGDDLCHDF